jgi:hypothetical protein
VVQGQLDLLDEITDCRRALGTTAARARAASNATAASAASESLAATTSRLERALTRARVEIGSGALRLRRTRYPGVRRAGDLYAVPSIDEAGIESVPTFSTFREAKAYRRAQRLREKTFSSKIKADTIAEKTLARMLHGGGDGGVYGAGLGAGVGDGGGDGAGDGGGDGGGDGD